MGLEVKQEGGGIERERIDDQRCECNNSCYLGGRVLSYGGHQKNLRGGNKKKTKRIDPISLYVSNSSSSNYICTTITTHTHIHTPPASLFVSISRRFRCELHQSAAAAVATGA
jgi:hypothetical protein